MPVDFRLDLLRIFNAELHAFCRDKTLIANLAAAFCIERCVVEYDDAGLTFRQLLNSGTFKIQTDHGRICLLIVVTGKYVTRAGVFHCALHLELACCAACGFLFFHRGSKTCFINAHAVFAANIG